VYNPGLLFQPNEALSQEITGATVTSSGYVYVHKTTTHRLWIEIFVNKSVAPQPQQPKQVNSPVIQPQQRFDPQFVQSQQQQFQPQPPQQQFDTQVVQSQQQFDTQVVQSQQQQFQPQSQQQQFQAQQQVTSPQSNGWQLEWRPQPPPEQSRNSVVPDRNSVLANNSIELSVMPSNEESEEPPPVYLPPHWEEKMDARGRIYYTNHVLRTTQWKRPIM